MAAFNKFDQLVEDVASGVHNLKTGTAHVLMVVLTNTLPAAGNKVLADVVPVAPGNGYAAGGLTAGTVTGGQVGGVFKLTLAPVVFTAAGGSVGPFQYAVLYNSTPAAPLKPLIGWWVYAASITLLDGESFTVGFDPAAGVLTIT